MTWLQSVIAGGIAAAAGAVVAAIVALAAFHWYPFTGLEGAAVLFVILNAVLGAVIAFLIGLLVSRGLNAWVPSFIARRAPLAGVAVVILIGAITALTLWMLADIPPELGGQRLNLEVEFRLPSSETTTPSDMTDPAFTLSSITSDRVKRKQRTGVLKTAEARQDADRWIIPGTVLLFTSRGGRQVEAHMGGELIGSFTLPLPGKPESKHETWSEWLPRLTPAKTPKAPSKAATPGASKTPPPPASKTSSTSPSPSSSTSPAPPGTGAGASKTAVPFLDVTGYRFRVTRIPPGQLPADEREQKQASSDKSKIDKVPIDKTRIDSLKPDAPIADWFAHTRLGAPDANREVAIRNIIARPNYVEELSALMLENDHQKASEALYLVNKLPVMPPELTPGVAAAGRDIAARLDKLNEAKLDANATAIAAADITIRFSAWMDAVRALRYSSVRADMVPELLAILERSRVRTDIPSIQEDVRRVASKFAKDWARVPPAAGDPPW